VFFILIVILQPEVAEVGTCMANADPSVGVIVYRVDVPATIGIDAE
jgi:hypothetical protein